jgi:hypothetical protein
LQKKEVCEKIIEDYLLLDRGEAVPLKLWTHLLFCKDCRTEVRFLNLADTACTKPLTIERKKEESLAKTIISRIQNDPECKEIFAPKELTLKNWIISGLIMLFAMLFFTINIYSQNSQIALPVYLVFAVFISGYCALFVGSNMDFFIKKLHKLEIQF